MFMRNEVRKKKVSKGDREGKKRELHNGKCASSGKKKRKMSVTLKTEHHRQYMK